MNKPDGKALEQLLAVRDSGMTNMLDLNAVQRISFDRDFYELVNFIEENRLEYINFIMHGRRE